MDHDEAPQEPKLRDGEVAAVDRLAALLSGDADTHVGLLDHAHVVRPVSDGQSHRHRVHVLLHEFDDEGLLARADSAGNHGLADRSDLEEHPASEASRRGRGGV